MFQNLIESQSHRKEFQRRGSFFLFTVAGYALILFGAGIGSIYAYDAQLEAQDTLIVDSWVLPVTPPPPKPIVERAHATPRPPTSTHAPVDQHLDMPMRTQAIAPVTDPNKVPDKIGTEGPPVPPVIGPFKLGPQNLDPPTVRTGESGDCIGCSNSSETVKIPDKPPEPPAVKQSTIARLPSNVLVSKAIALPQPAYPMMAKQTRTQGNVNIQILVDEQGKVLSAQVISGNPMLVTAAKEAAMRARFTPTVLNGQAVRTQGVIIYNFVLQ
jgi:TonB family protein